MRIENITLDMYAVIIITILLIVCIFQRKYSQSINKYLIGWMISHILMLCCDGLRWCLRGKIETLSIFIMLFFSEYILAYLCLSFFHYYLIDYIKDYAPINRKLRFVVWPVTAAMSVLWLLSYQNRMFYVITYNAVNVQNEGYYFSQLPAGGLLLFDMALVFFYRKKMGWRAVLALWLCMIFPLIAFPMQNTWNAEVLFIGMTLSLLTRYISISSEQNRLLSESRAHLAESRIATTMSQIHPHFLYNALGSISALCDIDPVRAREATDHFAGYLRMNLESMTLSLPIPFQRELTHIETYIWLEKMRFGEKLRMEYDIQAVDFQVPALSVQPIIENAVKHGICIKEEGGKIKLSTWESKNYFCIKVSDDGVGFRYKEQVNYNDEKLYIGIKNVRNRLEAMVGGSLDIRSRIGEGTSAMIWIPKKQMKTTREDINADRSRR